MSRMNFMLLSVVEHEFFYNLRAWSEILKTYEPSHEKTNILVSDIVRHKPGCTATEDG